MDPLKELSMRLLAYAPKALLVLAVLLVGLIASSVLRRVGIWLVKHTGLESAAESAGISKMLYAVGAKKGLANLFGSLAYLAGLLLTLAAVADLLSLPAVSTLTSLAVQFLPKLFAAGAVLLGGLWLAAVVRRVLREFGKRNEELDSPDLVAQIAYYVIVTITVTWSAQQAGLSTGIIDSLIQIVVGLGLFSLALAFGLGFRTLMTHIAARHYYERMLQPGDKVRVGDLEGIVLRYSPIALIVETEQGERIVPCASLLDKTIDVQPMDDPNAAE